MHHGPHPPPSLPPAWLNGVPACVCLPTCTPGVGRPPEISQPPFEVTETGWGEFEIAIHIQFHDPLQPPVSVVHLLKLHPSPHTQASQHKVPSMGLAGWSAVL